MYFITQAGFCQLFFEKIFCDFSFFFECFKTVRLFVYPFISRRFQPAAPQAGFLGSVLVLGGGQSLGSGVLGQG